MQGSEDWWQTLLDQQEIICPGVHMLQPARYVPQCPSTLVHSSAQKVRGGLPAQSSSLTSALPAFGTALAGERGPDPSDPAANQQCLGEAGHLSELWLQFLSSPLA